MDVRALALLCRALTRRFRGARLQKISQDRAGRLYLRLRAGGRSGLLCLSPDPAAPGIGLVDRKPVAPPTPPAATAYLRAHAEGAIFSGAHCAPGDRVIRLDFADPRGSAVALLLELLTPIPRLIVLDKAGVVRVVSPRLREGAGEAERIAPGRPYRPPETPHGATPEEGAEGVLERSGGTLLLHPVQTVPSPEEDDASLLAAGGWLFAHEEGGRTAGEARERSRAEKRWRKKLERRLGKIEADLERLGEEEGRNRRIADAVAARLGTIPPGSDALEVEEPPGSGRFLRVELDPGLTAGRNLDRLYAAAKKEERTRRAVLARLAVTKKELAEGPPPEVLALPGGPKSSHGAASQPYNRYRSSDNWPIWVGRNGRENDRLLREAKPWDLWFHARDGAGAHVLLLLPGREARVPERTLVEAAGLAALHSRRGGEKLVEVMVAAVSRVKKPKGASPGRVVVAGEETVRVAPGAGAPRPEMGRKGRAG